MASAKKLGKTKALATPVVIIADPDQAATLPLKILDEHDCMDVSGRVENLATFEDVTAWVKQANQRVPETQSFAMNSEFTVLKVPSALGKRTCKVEVGLVSSSSTLRSSAKFLAMPQRLRLDLFDENVRSAASDSPACPTCSNANRTFIMTVNTSLGDPFWVQQFSPPVCDAKFARVDLSINQSSGAVHVTFDLKAISSTTTFLVRYENRTWSGNFPIVLKTRQVNKCKGWPWWPGYVRLFPS